MLHIFNMLAKDLVMLNMLAKDLVTHWAGVAVRSAAGRRISAHLSQYRSTSKTAEKLSDSRHAQLAQQHEKCFDALSTALARLSESTKFMVC